jgi:hypothetical protein
LNATVALPAGVTVTASITSAGNATVAFNNASGAPVDIGAGTITLGRFDRARFIGAMEFYFNRIWADNPKARIVLIGHFENQRIPNVAAGQTLLGERTMFPMFKLWEKTGWSQQRVVGGTDDGKTQYEVWLTDGIHPHSEPTGAANDLLARLIGAWLVDNV